MVGQHGGQDNDELAAGADAARTAAREDVAKLRGVFEAIQEALVAATLRLEVLEGQVGDLPSRTDGDGMDVVMRPPRPAAQWKLAGWTPTGDQAVVSAETLRARREALGLSQAAVAHAAHCSRGLVAEVERGRRRSAQTLAHLATVLDRLEQQAHRN